MAWPGLAVTKATGRAGAPTRSEWRETSAAKAARQSGQIAAANPAQRITARDLLTPIPQPLGDKAAPAPSSCTLTSNLYGHYNPGKQTEERTDSGYPVSPP